MRRLEVFLGDLPLGELLEDEPNPTTFRFLPEYRTMPNRPVLGQRFEDDLQRVYKGKKGKLPAFFANLVPEGKLREVLGRHFGVTSDADWDFLAALGEDLPGAVRICPERPWQPRADTQSENAFPIERSSATERRGLHFSLAGVQMKLSMALVDDRLTMPARDELGRWIVKFDSNRFPCLPQNEHAMMEWAREAGFDVPECRLLDTSSLAKAAVEHAPDGSKVLAVRRYDRLPDGGRLHQEDFAQVVGLLPERKYDQITYEAMLGLSRQLLGDGGAREFIRRFALVIACGNNDAHLKNWSLLYANGIEPSWTPLYDQVSTIAWPDLASELALKVAAVKAFRRLDEGALKRLAQKADFPEQELIDLMNTTFRALRDAWPRIQDRIDFPVGHAQALKTHWEHVPLLKPFGPLD